MQSTRTTTIYVSISRQPFQKLSVPELILHKESFVFPFRGFLEFIAKECHLTNISRISVYDKVISDFVVLDRGSLLEDQKFLIECLPMNPILSN
jgi:hypothetical protein